MPDTGNNLSPGTLFIVSTPIGNLKDITLRAIEVLEKVDLIAAEDTRHTRILLERYKVKTPTTSYFDFNKEKKIPALIRKLQDGEKIALVSDAGTPGISDPAFRLVRECLNNDLAVETIPGATAFVPALILSGLPTDRFVFEGFLPVKKGRKTRLENLKEETRTIVLYESVHRISRTLSDLLSCWGDRKAAIAREITKKFEEVHRGSLREFNENLSQIKLKGEFVLVIEGKINRRKN
ncbi:16S rRNA (cytidine(1402)-2'-O)-methyltransferase [candidate division KSB1 bacterium]|nr:16S rRNA (cytidine(1402)-2'-O)-methyltransferase [candidate division KSB1 bacterium]MCH8980627.1 16S rRNA (cytidine(1402)-2'-O)-methyltransferase [candidate division KSB1 bacterium]